MHTGSIKFRDRCLWVSEWFGLWTRRTKMLGQGKFHPFDSRVRFCSPGKIPSVWKHRFIRYDVADAILLELPPGTWKMVS